MSKPVLTVTGGFSRLSATDENGCEWVEFEVDYGALEEDGECSECGATINSGWLCLDGGEEVCHGCAAVLDPAEDPTQE